MIIYARRGSYCLIRFLDFYQGRGGSSSTITISRLLAGLGAIGAQRRGVGGHGVGVTIIFFVFLRDHLTTIYLGCVMTYPYGVSGSGIAGYHFVLAGGGFFRVGASITIVGFPASRI